MLALRRDWRARWCGRLGEMNGRAARPGGLGVRNESRLFGDWRKGAKNLDIPSVVARSSQ